METWIIEWGLWGLFAASFAAATLLPGGSELAVVGLLLDGSHPWLSILLIATLGNTLGGLTSLALGRWLVFRFPDTRPKRLDAQAEQRLRRWGAPVLLLSWLPVVGDPLCVAAGWLRVAWLPALLAIATGKAARYGALVWLAT